MVANQQRGSVVAQRHEALCNPPPVAERKTTCIELGFDIRAQDPNWNRNQRLRRRTNSVREACQHHDFPSVISGLRPNSSEITRILSNNSPFVRCSARPLACFAAWPVDVESGFRRFAPRCSAATCQTVPVSRDPPFEADDPLGLTRKTPQLGA